MALSFNFPSPPQASGGGGMTFPEDLTTGEREYYTGISFAKYDYTLGSGFTMSFGSQVKLPMPRRINDNEVISWEEWSGGSSAEKVASDLAQLGGSLLGARGGIAGAIAGYAGSNLAGDLVSGAANLFGAQQGITVNPFMWMMFKRQQFKEHTLQWILAPKSEKDSDNLRSIINLCKKSALPPKPIGPGGTIVKYPDIAMIQLNAGKGKDKYLYQFKPCAIIAVQVDYTGAGMPAFFENGAPTIVSLTLQLKEIELWYQEEIQM